MTKSIWLNTDSGPVHMDVANEATTEDLAKMMAAIEELQTLQKQRRKDFESLWEQNGNNNPTFKDYAWKWFEVGYELAEMRRNNAT